MVIELIMAIYSIVFVESLKYALPLFGAWLAVSTGITFWAFRMERERHGLQG